MDACKAAPDEALRRAGLRALIERRLDQLPEELRVVFVLRSVEELGAEETAQCLGIPEATVRSRHFQARGLLREALAREMDLATGEAFGFDGERCNRIVARVLARMDAARPHVFTEPSRPSAPESPLPWDSESRPPPGSSAR